MTQNEAVTRGTRNAARASGVRVVRSVALLICRPSCDERRDPARFGRDRRGTRHRLYRRPVLRPVKSAADLTGADDDAPAAWGRRVRTSFTGGRDTLDRLRLPAAARQGGLHG